MATAQRQDPFANVEIDDPLDLDGLVPAAKPIRPKVDKAVTRATAAALNFTSREPAAPAVVAAPAQPDPAPPRTQRRYTTGRNRQLNLKVTDEALARFYALAEGQGWVLGQAFEEAVAALEAKLAKG